MILFVYFFVGATTAFISCPFSHGYKGIYMCFCVIDEWGATTVITDPLDLQMIASQPKIICFISRVCDAREREQSFKGYSIHYIQVWKKKIKKISIILFC